MSNARFIPRILIIDDLFGRCHRNRMNQERGNLCGQYLIEDVTGDEIGKGTPQKIKRPVAQAVFCRGQQPACSTVGDVVENDPEGVLDVVRDGWLTCCPGRPRWAMVLLDLCFYTGRVTEESNRTTLGMPEGRENDRDPQHYFGLRILKAIHSEFPDLAVVILSSQPRDEVSYEFTRHGALGFLARDAEGSPELLEEYLSRHGLIPDETGEIVGGSVPLLLALRAARRASPHQQNILIRGERGTGKEMLAKYIHRQSADNGQRRLITVNSGGLSPELFGSTLFGHRRGAFTGADSDREGDIVRADGGDLFLDEIGNMPPDIQAGVLRVLEYGEVVPVGAREGQHVSVRFLSATNEDLDMAASCGRFRPDLLDRLRMGGVVCLPPLRERIDDIPLLVEKFVRTAERQTPGAMVREVDPEAMERIKSHPWLGNVRELATCINNAVKQYPDVEHLVPLHLQFSTTGGAVVTPPADQAPTVPAALPDRIETQTLDDLIRRISSLPLVSQRKAELAGKLPPLQQAFAGLLIRYLKAALEATGRFMPTGDGQFALEVLIHPAMKLVTGNKKLTASKAADVIKRIVRLFPESEAAVQEDPVLREAYETALRLRPKQSKSKEAAEGNTSDGPESE